MPGNNKFDTRLPLLFAVNAEGIDSEKEGLFYPSNSIPALPMGMPMAKGQGY